MKKWKFFALTVALTVALAVPLWSGDATAGNAKKGKKVSRKCIACHDMTKKKKNKVGPYLWGIVDQPAGKVSGYKKYSKKHLKAAEKKKLVWDEATLDIYLKNPKKFIPGNKMAFAGLKKAKDRANLIAYMKTLQ